MGGRVLDFGTSPSLSCVMIRAQNVQDNSYSPFQLTEDSCRFEFANLIFIKDLAGTTEVDSEIPLQSGLLIRLSCRGKNLWFSMGGRDRSDAPVRYQVTTVWQTIWL